ncbi:MAG: GNAT family N-acetyltransferase [Enterococcus sp.]|nr:GNAT family N-acetyltransferase [Enterococcus sp.]
MSQTVRVVRLREHPEKIDSILSYVKKQWASEETTAVYEDCLTHALTTKNVLPQWYALMAGEEIIGCAGLITNDFISRMDLWPWLCAVYVDTQHRGRFLSKILIESVEEDARRFGFENLFLATDHEGLYEKMAFHYIGDGYHPWGEHSRIYKKSLRETFNEAALRE